MDFRRNGLVEDEFNRYYRGMVAEARLWFFYEFWSSILEFYYLTTNRIGDFDEPFISGVHMSMYYPKLDEEKTPKVFELKLELIRDRFKKQGREIIFGDSSIEDFAKQTFTQHKYSRWNGRQIRNLCQTARLWQSLTPREVSSTLELTECPFESLVEARQDGAGCVSWL